MNKKKTLIVIGAIFLGCFLGVTLFLVNNKIMENQNNYSKNKNEITNNENDDKEIEKLLALVPFFSESNSDDSIMNLYDDAYRGDYVTKNDIKEAMLYVAIKNTAPEIFTSDLKPSISKYSENEIHEVSYYAKDKIEKFLLNNFNLDEMPTISKDGTYNIFLDNNYYIKCILGDLIATDEYKHTFMTSSEKKNDEIIIYEDVLFYAYDSGSDIGGQDNVYLNTKDMSYQINSIGQINNSINDFKDQAIKYKHIFKKNSNGYYWFSTEVV